MNIPLCFPINHHSVFCFLIKNKTFFMARRAINTGDVKMKESAGHKKDELKGLSIQDPSFLFIGSEFFFF